MELNPNHPVTQFSRDQWHKICALLVFKSGQTTLTIDEVLIEAFRHSDQRNIVLRADDQGLHLSLVSDVEAVKLARDNAA